MDPWICDFLPAVLVILNKSALKRILNITNCHKQVQRNSQYWQTQYTHI